MERFASAAKILLVACAYCTCSAATWSQCRYEITAIVQGPDCGSSGLADVVGWDLNNKERIVGSVRCVPLGRHQSVVWNEQLVALPMPDGATESRAYGVNEQGCIAGYVEIDEDEFGHLAFLYDGSTTQLLEIFAGHNWSEANATNVNGDVVGRSGDVVHGPSPLPFLWRDGQAIRLIELLDGPRGLANDINDQCQIVGWMGSSANTDSHAFILDYETGKLTDLGVVPGGTTAEATAINNDGDVVGHGWRDLLDASRARRAFMWSGGVPIDLGVLPGKIQCLASDVNDRRQVVGFCDLQGSGSDAFLWQNGTMWDLNDLVSDGVSLDIARAINDQGQILANGRDSEANAVAFLLSPVDIPIGDITGDCSVGFADVLVVLSEWGLCKVCSGDINNDGVVSFEDLLLILAN